MVLGVLNSSLHASAANTSSSEWFLVQRFHSWGNFYLPFYPGVLDFSKTCMSLLQNNLYKVTCGHISEPLSSSEATPLAPRHSFSWWLWEQHSRTHEGGNIQSKMVCTWTYGLIVYSEVWNFDGVWGVFWSRKKETLMKCQIVTAGTGCSLQESVYEF